MPWQRSKTRHRKHLALLTNHLRACIFRLDTCLAIQGINLGGRQLTKMG